MGRSPAAELQARLEHEVAHKRGDFNAQNLSNTLWALASMGRPPAAELQARLEHEVARKLGDFNAQSLSKRCGRSLLCYARQPRSCKRA